MWFVAVLVCRLSPILCLVCCRIGVPFVAVFVRGLLGVLSVFFCVIIGGFVRDLLGVLCLRYCRFGAPFVAGFALGLLPFCAPFVAFLCVVCLGISCVVCYRFDVPCLFAVLCLVCCRFGAPFVTVFIPRLLRALCVVCWVLVSVFLGGFVCDLLPFLCVVCRRFCTYCTWFVAVFVRRLSPILCLVCCRFVRRLFPSFSHTHTHPSIFTLTCLSRGYHGRG